jgi:hypothetical protein
MLRKAHERVVAHKLVHVEALALIRPSDILNPA